MDVDRVGFVPDSGAYLERLADALLQSGRIGEAGEIVQQWATPDPGSAGAHELTAVDDSSNWRPAEEHRRAVLAVSPNARRLLRNLAVVLPQRKRHVESIDSPYEAVKPDAGNTEVLERLHCAVRHDLPSPVLRARHHPVAARLPRPERRSRGDCR